ncbi:hypothetical protein SLS60_001974 [Paraconiothyrium brasiliense]|uniref:Uncharacterized protein n=1 Tax=Paraconiothyrium brasiliense TaxID=300254 RepID=A0ABR3S1D3_9PLEO
MSTPAALSLAHSIYEYLHPIYSQAYASRERRMLSLFGHVPQAFKAVQKLATQEAEQRMKPSASTEPTLGSKKASRRQRRSTEEPRGVPTLGHQGTEVVGSPSSSFGSRKRPNTGLEWKRKGIDPETNVTSHHEGLDPPRKVRKSTEHRTRTSDVKPRRDDGLKGQTVPSFEECLRVSLDSIQTDSTTLEIAQSPGLAAVPEEPASKEGQRLPSKGKPTVSFTEPNANHADLRLQLQYLMEQVRLLNEKIAAPTTAEGGTKQATTPHSASPTNHSTTQASDTPKVAKPVESPKTIALQQSDDTKVPLASSGDSANALVQPPVLTTSLASIDQSPNPTPVRRYDPKSQAKLQNERLKPVPGNNGTAQEPVSSAPSEAFSYLDKAAETSTDGQRLFRQIHTQARLMRSSDYSNVDTPTIQTSSLPPTEAPLENGERSEQSLLDELFPEASNYIQPHYGKRNPYPKLNPPNAAPIVRRYTPPREKLSSREKYIQAFQRSAEKMTTLQLLHCSTELTDADFRRLEPKGRHIEGWVRDDDFHQVIPGRDPLSLERLPFYYLIFKNPEAALRYQSNAMRLHKLSKLHGPDSSLSAIPPPPGLLENGEDINTALSSYLLTPTSQNLQLNMVVQPYNPALARLIEEGGYAPIVPSTNSAGTQIHKVLFYVEGYEPSPYDLYQIFMQDASSRGFAWPFLHEHLSIHRLRDIVDLKTRFRSVSANNPRASSVAKRKLMDLKDHDPYASFLSAKEGGESDDAEGQDAKTINQIIMNRVYNRWIVEFSEEAGARRFARLWHRKVLPMQDSVLHRTWRDVEEVRMCNAEYLW